MVHHNVGKILIKQLTEPVSLTVSVFRIPVSQTPSMPHHFLYRPDFLKN